MSKKALLIECAGEISTDEKFAQKSVYVKDFKKETVEGAETAVVCSVADLEENLKKEVAFLSLSINNESELNEILKIVDRQTTIVVIAQNGLFFYGYGVAKGAEIQRAVFAKDIVPTLSYMVGFPIPRNAVGAVIYQALKDPDGPSGEIAKLKIALERMEAAMARENKEPWDKHDCA